MGGAGGETPPIARLCGIHGLLRGCVGGSVGVARPLERRWPLVGGQWRQYVTFSLNARQLGVLKMKTIFGPIALLMRVDNSAHCISRPIRYSKPTHQLPKSGLGKRRRADPFRQEFESPCLLAEFGHIRPRRLLLFPRFGFPSFLNSRCPR